MYEENIKSNRNTLDVTAALLEVCNQVKYWSVETDILQSFCVP